MSDMMSKRGMLTAFVVGLAVVHCGMATDFTWSGGATDGKWTSPENWTSSAGGGYPSSVTDVAIFPEGTSAEVCFDTTVDFQTLCISNRNLNLHFTSSNDSQVKCALNAGTGMVVGAKPSWIVFDGMSIVFKWPRIMPDAGINVRLTDGTSAMAASGWEFISTELGGRQPLTETVLEVLDGAVFTSNENLTLSGDATIVISNATVKVKNFTANGGSTAGDGGGRIRFMGESPRLEVSEIVRLSKSDVLGGNPEVGADFDFIVPEGGYASAPIVCTDSGSLFGVRKEFARYNRFNISSESPLFKGSTYGSWTMVSCPSGAIVTNRLVCATGRSLLSEAWVVETNAPASLTYVRANPAAVLEVTAEPYEVGRGDYGIRRDLAEGATLTLAAPTPPEGSGLEIAGYRLYSIAADGTATEVPGSPFADSTCAYVHGKSARRIVWQWRQPTVYVSPTGSDENGGTSPDDALATIQAGVDKYAYGKVVVAPGIYRSNKAVTVGNGVTVVGGGEKPSDVTLVGIQSTTLFYAKNVLVLTGELAQVRNVRLTKEKGSFGESGVKMEAGLLENCEIVECYTSNNSVCGGGIWMSGGTVRDCLVSNNCARSSAGVSMEGNGIYMTGGLVENCRILDNEKNDRLLNEGVDRSKSGGGGVRMLGGTLRGCLVKGNNHRQFGAGVFASNGTIENCTIVENGSLEATGPAVFLGWMNGLSSAHSSRALFRNNIVRDNFDANGENNVGGNLEGFPTANCTKPVLPVGRRNIDVDPQFDADYGLGDSACVDGGVLFAWMEGAVDLAGLPRAPRNRPDLGCFERQWAGFRLIIR